MLCDCLSVLSKAPIIELGSGGRRRASKKLAEADPKQDQRDGERSKEPTEDKTPAEPVDKGKQVLRAKTGECHDNNTGA